MVCKSVFARETPEKMKPRMQTKTILFNSGNIFGILTFRTEEIAWWPLCLNLISMYFPIMNNPGKLKEISSTSFYCIIRP